MRKSACALLIFGLALVPLAGCTDGGQAPAAGEQATQAPATSEVPEKARLAAEIANEIQANPDQAEPILQKHGMTEEQFQQLLYDVAADPELSKAYQAALKR